LRPTPISRIDAWAQTQAVEEVYSLAANALNDDRIGRALDEVPAQTMNGQPVAKITYGFTGKEDPSRKQLTLSLSVAADGGIPAWYRLADGNAADTRAYLAHLTAVRLRPVYRQLTFCQLCPPMIHMGTAELANVQRKVAEAVAKVKQYVETEVIEMSDGLDVRWRLQPECLRQDAQFDGFYCVLTNEAETQAPMQAIFRTYKEQSKVERRFRMVKQPPIQAQVLDRLGLMKPVSYLQPTITPHPTGGVRKMSLEMHHDGWAHRVLLVRQW
jgi:hypothetical protein